MSKKTDREILHDVMENWKAGLGGSSSLQIILEILQKLENEYGDSFSIEKASQLLTKISRRAELVKKSLSKAQRKESSQARESPKPS